MVKKTIIVILLFFLWQSSKGQYPWYKPVEMHQGKKYYLEFIVAGSYADLRFAGSIYNQFDRQFSIKPSFGLAFRMQLPLYFSVAPTIWYENRGASITDDIGYTLNAQYLSLGIPFEYNWPFHPRTRSQSGLFASLGPYVATPLKGSIQLDGFQLPLNKSNINLVDAGLEIGAGIRLTTFSSKNTSNLRFKIAYARGFIDSYSQSERNGTANAVNLPKYIVEGRRYHQHIKLSLSFELPFEQREVVSFTAGGDGSRTYKRYVTLY